MLLNVVLVCSICIRLQYDVRIIISKLLKLILYYFVIIDPMVIVLEYNM